MTKDELNYWLSVTENSRFKWTEDTIFRLNGRGSFYYTGGEDGIYMKIEKDGLLEGGTYEGAIPHIGEAVFMPVATKQYADYSGAFTAAMEAGGKKFLLDMFSADAPAIPPQSEKEMDSIMHNKNRSRQIDAKLVNADDMVSMFRDMDRLRNSDFAFCWHRFPTTKEELQAALKGIGTDGKDPANIIVNDYDTVIYELNGRLPQFADLDELNYLAVKMDGLTEAQHNIFRSVVEAGRHCESMKDIINITENIDCFDLQPAFSAEMYGEFQATMYQDYFAQAIETLEKSSDPYMREFAAHIVKLDGHLNSESYGRALAEQENGVFTEQGYLTESEGFREVYRGPEDIPPEYRVSAPPEREPKERPSVMDKLAAAKEAAARTGAGKSDTSKKSHDAEL